MFDILKEVTPQDAMRWIRMFSVDNEDNDSVGNTQRKRQTITQYDLHTYRHYVVTDLLRAPSNSNAAKRGQEVVFKITFTYFKIIFTRCYGFKRIIEISSELY